MKRIFFILTIILSRNLASLTWTIENINGYRVDKPSISVDSVGNAFIFGNSSGGNDIIGYIQNTSGLWQRDSLLFSRETGINYNCRVSSARCDNGTLHVLYRVAGGTYGWPVYSNNAGGAFVSADTLVKNGGQSTFHYGIAADDLNRAHIICEIYSGSSSITYFCPFADTSITIANGAMDGTITTDRNNAVHIAYAYPASSSRIYYTNNSSGSFFTPVLVSDSIGLDPSIAVDSMGFAHITWTTSYWEMTSELYYATNATGAFQTAKITTTPNICEAWPHIAIAKDNAVGIVYSRYHPAPPYVTDIFFAYKKAGDPVFSIDSVSPGHWNPSYGATTWNDKAIAFDDLGYVHLAYAGASGTEYAKSITLIGVEEAQETHMPDIALPLKLTCSPNPFHENLAIHFQMPILDQVQDKSRANSDPQVSIIVYDVIGRILKIFHPVPCALCPTLFTWSGTDQSGERLPAGVYLIHVTANYDGKRYIGTKKVILTE
jgi:hypothetical protein